MSQLIKFSRFFLFLFALLLLAPWPAVARANLPAQAPACTPSDPGPTAPCISEMVVRANTASPFNHFVVSWISASAGAGRVLLVGSGAPPAFDDVRGASFSGITHYVQVDNIAPGATYQFDIVSGGVKHDNNGAHWSVTVGPVLADAPPRAVLGHIRNPDGSDADEAIVYATLQRLGGAPSSLISTVIRPGDEGLFRLPLADALRANYTQRYSFDPTKDKITFTAVGPGGWSSTTVVIDVALPPQPSPPNVDLTLGSGPVTVSTPTPTALPPTSTPTPAPPSATPSPLPATQTAAAATATRTLSPLPPTPRPSATRPPPSPTPEPLITIIPAGQTRVATSEAESTLQAAATQTEEAIPEITRFAASTPTPGAGLNVGGVTLSSLLFPLLALVAFAGALALGGVAYVAWKK